MKVVANRFFRRLTLGRKTPPRHASPYATHLPILVAIGRILSVKKIVEFGCGMHSTPTFLDRAVFENVVNFVSFESNADWASQLATTISDPRLDLRCVDHSLWATVARDSVAGADLIFVDDSESANDRVETIRLVEEHAPDDAVVIVHDFEISEYREAIAWRHQLTCKAYRPETGVLSRSPLPHAELRRAFRKIRKKRHTIPPNSVLQWAKLLGPNK